MANRYDWESMSDEQLVEQAETQIWLSAEEADKAYREAARRRKPWLYARAWNRAYESCGHKLSDFNRMQARPDRYDEDGRFIHD